MQLDPKVINPLVCGTDCIRHWRDLTKQKGPVTRLEIHASHKIIKIRTKGIKIKLIKAEASESLLNFNNKVVSYSDDYLEKYTNTFYCKKS